MNLRKMYFLNVTKIVKLTNYEFEPNVLYQNVKLTHYEFE